MLPDVVPKLFVKFSKDIANGMSYLAKKCFIHRDLAARNILLNDELTCKASKLRRGESSFISADARGCYGINYAILVLKEWLPQGQWKQSGGFRFQYLGHVRTISNLFP